MTEPKFREYCKLLGSIFSSIIFKYKSVAIAAMVSAILVFWSTYYITELAAASSILLERDNPNTFYSRLLDFSKISFLSITLRCLPLAYFTYLIQHISKRKFVEMLRSYMTLPYYKFHTKTPGEIRFIVFLKSLSYPICSQIIVFDFTSLLGSTIFTFIKAYNDINLYAAIIFSVFPFVYICYMLIFLKYRIMYRTLNLAEQEKTSSKIYDKLSNFDVIKSYNLEESQIDLLRNDIKGQIDTQLATDVYTAKGKYVGRFLIIFPYLLLAVSSLLKPNSLTGSVFFQATLLYSSLSFQIKKLGSQLVKLSSLLNQIGYENLETEINEGAQNHISSFNHKIEFVNVDLFYGNKIIIQGINCEINKNEKIAVVGTNGTGKSTFIKSILGFTKYNGDIFIDGCNIKDLSNRSIFSLISYISQDDYTSDDTIINNIRLGNRSASENYIMEKSRLFECHEMFSNLDNGYETHAGIKGNRLSGGQRQKLSLVRAAVKDSPIFILDEATAAIDKNYETRVLNIILKKLHDKTIMMIIHEKEYLKDFDKILFLNNGYLEASGNYEALLNSNLNFKNFIAN